MGPVINVKAAETINFADSHRDAAKIISSLSVQDLHTKAVIRIYSTPEFFFPFKEDLTPGPQTSLVVPINLTLNDAFFRKEVVENKDAVINIELISMTQPQTILCSKQIPVKLQPYLFWNRSVPALACFMQPNSPLVVRVMKRAGEIANAAGGIMAGYLKGRDLVMKQAEWIFRALQEESIHYYLPAPGWEIVGQKIRIPEMILNQDCKQGTCLDLALLYASCLEAASLHPLLFLIRGHAFTGVWLDENAALPRAVSNDFYLIKRQLAGEYDEAAMTIHPLDGAIVPVECTLACDYAGSTSFLSSHAVGLNNLQKSTFECAVDIARCRQSGYLPAFTYAKDPLCEPELMKPAAVGMNKYERMLRQAMDLSVRNRMLSMPDGNSFVMSSAAFFSGALKDEELFNAYRETEKRELHLLALFDADKASRRSVGYGCVYLTVDRVRWIPKNEKTPVCSPLYLCPCKIYRNTVGKIVFRPEAEKTRLNPVLRERLRQDYAMDLSSCLEMPGKYYERERALLCAMLTSHDGWCLEDNVMSVDVFQLPNESIYRRLRSEKVLQHPVVNGILKGSMSWSNQLQTEKRDIEAKLLAFAADSSQRKAIKTVAEKRAQILFGPAGNGKSQTIANLIVEQMAAGKHVLFVAEKPSAQQVVAEKLEELSLDPFCLWLKNTNLRFSDLQKKIERTLRIVLEEQGAARAPESFDDSAAMERLSAYYRCLYGADGGGSLADVLRQEDVTKAASAALAWNGGDELLQQGADSLAGDYARACVSIGRQGLSMLPWMKGFAKEEYRENRDCVDRCVFLADRYADVAASAFRTLGMPYRADNGDELMRWMQKLTQCPVIGKSIAYLPSEAEQHRQQQLMTVIATAPPNSKKYSDAFEELFEKKSHQNYTDDPGPFRAEAVRPQINPRPYNREEKQLIEDARRFESYQQQLLSLAEGCTEEEKRALLRLSYRIARDEGGGVLATIHDLQKAYAEYQSALSQAAGKTQLFDAPHAAPPVNQVELLKFWQSLSDEQMRTYAEAREKLELAGLASLVRQIDRLLVNEGYTAEQIHEDFRACCDNYQQSARKEKLRTRLPEANRLCKALGDPLREEQAERRTYRDAVYQMILASMPTLAEGVEGDPALGSLQRIIRKRESGMNPRALFMQAGSAMMRLFPCMIADPATVAEWLPEEMAPFDLVVFDESSQLPTYKALVPLSMADRCLITGDEKQLLPSAFFRRNEEDEFGGYTAQEAFLEDAIASSLPQNLLRVHYRSKSEDLISFSNERYYGNRLFSIPSPEISQRGVRCVTVENAVYDRGGSRTNALEAEAVCREVRKLEESLPDPDEESIGVITFNLEQARLIRSLLEKADAAALSTARVLSDRVDVVNLEACQGREWDYVFLSTTFAPDQNGTLSMNFGPMNRAAAGNRLNVMITRARKQNTVVTSLKASQFSGELSAGMSDLRDYIAFARGERNSAAQAEKRAERQKDILCAVADALRQRGYSVQIGIGSSRCQVDLGIVSKDGRRYLLGIRLDNEDDAISIRDWEITFPEALQARGWTLYRLYTLNWYQDAEGEMRKIEALLAGIRD